MNSQDIIFGTRPVLEAIKSGKTIEKLFLQKNLFLLFYIKKFLILLAVLYFSYT